MIKFILTHSLEFLLGLTVITQVIIPLFVPKLKIFWLFRDKSKNQES